MNVPSIELLKAHSVLGPEKTQTKDKVLHCPRCIMVTTDKQQSMGMSLPERRREDGDGGKES